MRQRLRAHLTYANVMVTILAFIVLGGSAIAATGGNFILGQSNSAGTPTKLSSPTTDTAGALRVANTSTTGAGNGVVASGAQGGSGVWASGGDASKNRAAIHGQSGAGNAVEGISGKNTASGVYGQNNSTGFGVAGRSANGTGVMGDSSGGWAMAASGNATQSRAGGGFVKAMAYVNPQDTSDPIKQCFNSQVLGGAATFGDCGISYSSGAGGQHYINFGFKVDDRVASVTPTYARLIVNARPASTNAFQVDIYDEVFGSYRSFPFYIVVY